MAIFYTDVIEKLKEFFTVMIRANRVKLAFSTFFMALILSSTFSKSYAFSSPKYDRSFDTKVSRSDSKSRGTRITQAQASEIVRNQMKGKILKVQRAGKDYRVKLVKPDGKVTTVIVDGKTGRIRQ